MIEETLPWAVWGGAVVGVLFGALMQRSRLCLVTAVGNWMLIRDPRHLRAFLAGIAVAVSGTYALEVGGWVAIGASAYRAAPVDWTGAIGGGLLFGIGAALAGGCVARSLARAGEGGLGPALTLLGVAAAASVCQYGWLSAPRAALAAHTAWIPAGGDSGIAALTGVPAWVLVAGVVAVCALGIATLRGSLPSGRLTWAGAGAGALVVLAWYVTGHLAQDEFEPTRPVAITLTGPLARLGLTLSGGAGFEPGFGVDFLLGVLGGACAAALFSRDFRWRLPPWRMLLRMLVGGLFMGIGATFAGGCNIGQGLSGVSTLAAQSLLAAVAILAGTALGVRWLEWRG